MAEPAAMKTCFVISPIGQPGSDVREHADDVFDYVIRPALQQAGYQPLRADHMTRPGLITEQMYQAILTSDLVIAVITFRNPNVFYELAIAQAAARPVIILNLKDDPIPFDIKDIRITEYDLKPRSLMEGVHARSLLAVIHAVETQDTPQGVVFDRRLAPLGAPARAKVFYDSAEELSWPLVSSVIEQAGSRLWLMGISQYWWLKRPSFMELVRRIGAQPGFDFRVLIMHEDNAALPMMLRDAETQLDVVRSEIASAQKLYGQLTNDAPALKLKQVVRGCVLGALNLSDYGAIYTPYLTSASSRLSPAIVCRSGDPGHGKFDSEFRYLWDQN